MCQNHEKVLCINPVFHLIFDAAIQQPVKCKMFRDQDEMQGVHEEKYEDTEHLMPGDDHSGDVLASHKKTRYSM